MIEPTRAAALAHLADFTPRMGRDYAAGRNSDPGPGARTAVTELSPHIRHRLITEEEVVRACLARHSPTAALKFVQEMFWRTYWKGYLELRPQMWTDYKGWVARVDPAVAADAMAGRTGIACFDAWVAELKTQGYLHNHARMWFASIWIFTLRLPWVLGAEFFLAHLKDGDAASNTLSWRWVAGIQTPGRNYLARAENIARYTDGRFHPVGELDENAAPLTEPGPPPPGMLSPADPAPTGRVALLLHEDDLSFWPVGCDVVGVGGVCFPSERSIFAASPVARDFTIGALADGLRSAAARIGGEPVRLELEDVGAWARGLGVRDVAMPWSPVGWTANMLQGVELDGVRLHRVRREWDSVCWPQARAGFFGMAKKIPFLLERFRLMDTPQGALRF